jgi:DNA-binding XRE family transcriptional regulator
MQNLSDLTKKIKARREQLGYTQTDLVELTGISLKTIRSIETGQANTGILFWLKIADVLGLEMKIQFKSMSDETGKGLL